MANPKSGKDGKIQFPSGTANVVAWGYDESVDMQETTSDQTGSDWRTFQAGRKTATITATCEHPSGSTLPAIGDSGGFVLSNSGWYLSGSGIVSSRRINSPIRTGENQTIELTIQVTGDVTEG